MSWFLFSQSKRFANKTLIFISFALLVLKNPGCDARVSDWFDVTEPPPPVIG